MAPKIDNRGRTQFAVQKPAGFLKLATIDHCDSSLMIAYVKLRDPSIGSAQIVPAQLPISYLSSGGGYVGGLPAGGTPVLVTQAEGGSYFIVQFLARDPSAKNTTGAASISIPNLVDGEYVIQANDDGNITLMDDGIVIGEPKNAFIFDTNRKIIQNTFDNSYSLTEASRLIDGIIKRDITPSSIFAKALRSADTSYDDVLSVIGMDPIASSRNSNDGNSTRNPARVEKHEVVYEYQQFASVQSNDIELQAYNPNSPSNTSQTTVQSLINRREGRADALSLSLVSPNYLMENIKGTVVDVYGNIIDLNRNIIPIGQIASDGSGLSILDIKHTANNDTFHNVYEQIKRFERKSIAYHFEINARKETNGAGVPSVDNTSNYARLRSRFYLDVDKEGQFKLNVPASSEQGNIPLLTRYENYTTVNPDPATNDPNSLIFNNDNRDILIESFMNNESINLVDGNGNPSAPFDRNLSTQNAPVYIQHGSAYHNIQNAIPTFLPFTPYTQQEYVPITNVGVGRIKPLPYLVSNTIVTSGPNANAGGRSGQINFDGSIEINIGANTVDRQSAWIDTQGGIVAMIGRDLNNVSLASKLDGMVLIEIGGATVPPEQPGPNGQTRFDGYSSGVIAGALDVRVYDGTGGVTIFRVDQEGLTVSTLGRVVVSANQDVLIHSNATMTLEADTMIIQGREVSKDNFRGEI